MDKKYGKKRIFDIIQIGNTSDLPSRIFDIFIVSTILLNITTLFLQTFDRFEDYMVLLDAIDSFTVSIFVVEYILRIWTSEYLFPGKSRAYAVIHFLFSFEGIVDLLTILPFFWLSGFVAFRMLRVVRIFHLFRINANYDSFHVIKTVLYEKKNQLASSLFIILVLLLAASLFMYSAEHDAQPDVFRNAFSGIWWSVSTLLTVGYGDIYPITAVGKFLAIIIAFLGVGAVAIPTGIISAGFVEQYTQYSRTQAGAVGRLNANIDSEKTRNAESDKSYDTDDVSPGASDPALDLQTIVIDLDSGWIGKTTAEIKELYQADIVLVNRNRKSFVPSEDYRVQLGDALAVYFS